MIRTFFVEKFLIMPQRYTIELLMKKIPVTI